MNKIMHQNLNQDKRIIVISDIHGSLKVFKKLLNKVNYQSNEDYLILLGDYAHKGPFPLDTLHFIMDLAKNPLVFCLMGNCDHGNYKIFDEKYLLLEFSYFLKDQHSTLFDMKEKYIKTNPSFEQLSLSNKQNVLKAYYSKEISFLMELPLMLETQDFIFVHAGLDKIQDYQNSLPITLLMKRYFYYQGHLADKIVICGHMPVKTYKNDIIDDEAIIDLKRKIISIDGGLIVTMGGQLNALVISKNNNQYCYNTYCEDDLLKAKLINDNISFNQGKGVSWPHFEFTIIEKQTYFTKIKILDTDEITYIKNEYIKDNHIAKGDCSATILNVKKGEEVGIIDDNCLGYTLVKYKNKQGWIKKENIGEKYYEK